MTTLSQQTSEVSSTYSYLTNVLLVFPHHSNSCLPVYNKFTALAKISQLSPSFFIAFLHLPESLCTLLNTMTFEHCTETLTEKICCKHLFAQVQKQYKAGCWILTSGALICYWTQTGAAASYNVTPSLQNSTRGFDSCIYLQCLCTSSASIYTLKKSEGRTIQRPPFIKKGIRSTGTNSQMFKRLVSIQ